MSFLPEIGVIRLRIGRPPIRLARKGSKVTYAMLIADYLAKKWARISKFSHISSDTMVNTGINLIMDSPVQQTCRPSQGSAAR